MRGMDGLDGPPRFTYGGSWRSRYDDDYPPERTELWSGENRHRLDATGPRNRHRLDPTLRNDSLSSDPSDCMSAPAIPTASAVRLTPKHHRPHKNGGSTGGGPRSRRQSSMSSSDDGAQTTPEGTSCDEQEVESESIVSEMGASVLHSLVKLSEVKKSKALSETPSQNYGMPLAIWDHTVLPSTRHK